MKGSSLHCFITRRHHNDDVKDNGGNMTISAQANESPQWPVKTCEFQNHHTDSRRWNDFPFRSDDIVIATWAKSGTTWMQQIVSQLVFLGAEDAQIREDSPWLDMRVMPEEAVLASLQAQTHRRFIKTHCPLENMEYSPKAKYIFVARDGRDAIWSLHNHMYNATPLFYQLINDTPGRVGPALEKPPADPRQYFLNVLESDEKASAFLPSAFWKTTRDWYAVRDLPNLLIVHYNDLKADLEGEIIRIAEFLDVQIPEEKRTDIVEHCTFGFMKKNATWMSPPQSEYCFTEGVDTFVHKGTNGRWRDVLSADDVKLYEEKATAELGEECANWLANGKSAWEK